MIKISVFIPTFNPDIDRLNQTLIGLKKQNFPLIEWELILVDNNSQTSFIGLIDISWHNNSRIVKEPKPGLTYARIKGFQESQADLIIMVDDDNILSPDYLLNTYFCFKNNKNLGAVGGKSIPQFDFEPPTWLNQFHSSLALRNLGEEIRIGKWENIYPEFAPIGAGMALRKSALVNYIKKIEVEKDNIIDRQGTSLSSGGDNDMVIEILKAGWEIAYSPALSLTHIIPLARTDKYYLSKLNRDSTKSWILLLEKHNINPWIKISKWTIPLRKIKAWLVYKPWRSESDYIRFKGACGLYEALGMLTSKQKFK